MTDSERLEAKKAMAYDLLKILGKDFEKSYTVEEINNIIDAYLQGIENTK